MGKNRCNHCAPNRASGARLSLGEPPRVDRAELQTAAGNSPGRRLHLTLPAAAGPDRSPYGAGLYGIMGIRSSGTGSHRPGNGHEGLRPLPNLQNTGAQQKLCACFLACWSENVGSIVPCRKDIVICRAPHGGKTVRSLPACSRSKGGLTAQDSTLSPASAAWRGR